MKKKILYIAFFVTLFFIDIFAILTYYAFKEVMHYRYYYEYIDMDSNWGTSAYCFTAEDGRHFCRNAKKIYRVQEYEKMRVKKK